MTIAEWKVQRPPASKWRQRAREAMRIVVDAIGIMDPALLADRKAVLARVDASYPFGERKYEPYKCWLAERRLLIEALGGDIPAPSADEVGVCGVARDLVELGRYDEARALVEEQAPNRLARKCPACGARAGVPCALAPRTAEGIVVRMAVPHAARLVGHLDAGPLFRDPR